MKRCSKCKQVLSLDNFHRSTRDGYKSKCKDCVKSYSKTLYKSKRNLNRIRRIGEKINSHFVESNNDYMFDETLDLDLINSLTDSLGFTINVSNDVADK